MRTTIIVQIKDFDLSTLKGIEDCEKSRNVVILGGKDCGNYFQVWVIQKGA